MSLLSIQNVVKRYQQHTALSGVSLEVPQGQIFGLLGPNGAGKTSLIRIINQITMPDEGQILLQGQPLKAEDVHRISYLPEERGLYKKMKNWGAGALPGPPERSVSCRSQQTHQNLVREIRTPTLVE